MRDTSGEASRAGRRELWLGLAPVAAAGAVYAPLVGYPFFADHFLHLYHAANDGLARFLVRPHTHHVLITYRAVFYAFETLFGLRSQLWFLAVLLTHLANVFLLFRVIQKLTAKPVLAALGAALWGAAPVHIGSLGWLAVYSHVLVAPCLLWILLDVARVASGALRLSNGVLARWCLLLLAASTSFGVGLAVAMAAPGFVLLLLPAAERRGRAALALGALLVVIPLLYFSLHGLHAWLSAPGDAPGAGPKLAMLQGVLSPARWGRLLSVLAGLLAYGVSSLLLGPFIVAFPEMAPGDPRVLLAGALPAPLALRISVWIGVSFALLWAVCLWIARPTRRRQLLAFALIALASYGIIALGVAHALIVYRQGLAGLALEPRYQYVGGIAICVSLCLMLDLAARHRPAVRRVSAGILAAWIACMLPFSLGWSLTQGRSDLRAGRTAFAEVVARIEQRVDG
ncbi:MAG: hypothetical protein JSU66_14865, partial [Deltaproteobacteria bacterium]